MSSHTCGDVTVDTQFYRDGYLCVPSFLSSEDVQAMLDRSKQLLEELDLDTHPMVSHELTFLKDAD
jgi:phytanoyl-CoA hydroxylase